ncbi:MAG: 30S ribosomal protein S3 [Bdellovibrionaceae bacterium]|nr:30S ribosomal protein S3 [Pseudobdellovibrionaceae bacterium]MDW8190068.1 30S ribosomal protein S3 [Pseudobdellovibrionaceae bacterium]
MGQKVNPIGLRLGVIRTWDSRWYAQGYKYVENLKEDHVLRSYLKDRLKNSAVSKIDIERAANKVKVIVHTARPGIVIGKKGAGIDQLRVELQKLTSNEVHVAIQEIRKPDIDAVLVAENIALQLEKRVAWRRAIKKALLAAIKSGVRGIKIRLSGRLDGAEIARSEWYNEKSVPLHTLRADIDYGTAEALTTYGIIGVKVWIYKGDILSLREMQEVSRAQS